MMLIIRCLRPDRMLAVIQNYLQNTIGNDFVKLTVTDFDEIFRMSRANSPILVYSDKRMDPTNQIMKCSKKYFGAKIISVDYSAKEVCE